MILLNDGQQLILGTRSGLLRLTSHFDQPSSTWSLLDPAGEVVFQLADDERLVPIRPLNDPTVYTVNDLHEWGRRV
jgi:hypothetical protein